MLILNFFVTFAPRRELPYKIWLPCNLTTSFNYGIVLTFEIIGNTLGAYVNITYDTLLPSILLLACAQFCLLKRRVHMLGDVKLNANYSQLVEQNDNEKILKSEQTTFANCVEHQLLIFKLVFAVVSSLNALNALNSRASDVKFFYSDLLTQPKIFLDILFVFNILSVLLLCV
nr:olfactory receptor 116 [Aulacocentrum confusum]